MTTAEAGAETGPINNFEAQWYLEVNNRSWPVKIPYATNSDKPDILLMTGWGETQLSEIAEGMGSLGLRNLAVCNIVYPPDAQLTQDVIEQSILKGTRAVVQDINIRADRPIETKIIGAGHSKGAGEQIMSANSQPELWRLLIESVPIGVNSLALGSEFKVQRSELIKRMKREDLFHSQAVENEGTLIESVDSRRLFKEFKAGIEYALRQDGAKMVQYLSKLGLMKQLFVGENDHVFPAEEYEHALGTAHFVSRVKEVGHFSLLSEEGRKYMTKIIRIGMSG